MSDSRRPENNPLFLRLAIKRGWLKPDQAKQAHAQATGFVGDALVKAGVLNAQQVAEVICDMDRFLNPKEVAGHPITGEIGRGSMGVVYRAIQVSMQRPVALKVLAPRYALSELYSTRFFQEAQAAGVINHPNVISCYNVGEDHGLLYMVMELMNGGDLKQLIETSPHRRLPPKRAMQVVLDCARGLEAIERAGIVHRDLKPSNIFVAENGMAKIADLGLVQAEDTKDHGNEPIGTPLFMSPEQAQRAPDLDIRTDIYALGVTLFVMLTGRYPYTGSTNAEILAKVIRDPMPDIRKIMPGISQSLATLVRRMMAKDRTARYANAAEMREAVEALIASGDYGHEVATSTRLVHRPGGSTVETAPPDQAGAIPLDATGQGSSIFAVPGPELAPPPPEEGEEACPSCGGKVYPNAGVCMCGFNLDQWRRDNGKVPPKASELKKMSDSDMFRKPEIKKKSPEPEQSLLGKLLNKIKKGR